MVEANPGDAGSTVQRSGVSSASAAASVLESATLAFGNPPTAVTFSEGFLADDEAFFRVMDAASRGGFLRDGAATNHGRVGDAGNDARRAGEEACWGGKGEGPSPPLSLLADPANVTGGRRTGPARAPGDPKSHRLSDTAERHSHAGEDWVRSPWLVSMGSFTLAAFLANR